MTGTKLAVNVFEESKTPEPTPTPQQQNQQPADQPEAITPETKQQENTTNTTQVAQDDSTAMQNALSISLPWIAAGIVAIVILIALLTILRKLNRTRNT